MKLHASIGADILSAIDFPYPVVPIVRHHHENWDGTGYPDGLQGTAIPIGARILSVVDCFDALTSDRPYRPRMADTEAIRILLERRGTMYDPLIVDTFIALHAAGALAQSVVPATESTFDSLTSDLSLLLGAKALSPTVQMAANARLDEIAASTEETLVLYDSRLAWLDTSTLVTWGTLLRNTCDESCPHLTLCFLFTTHSQTTSSRCTRLEATRHT